MAKKENTQIIALEIGISESNFNTFASASADKPIPFIKGCVESYLHEYANGGLMLTASEVDRINKASKGKVKSSEEVIEAVEKSNKIKDGNSSFSITLDPSLVETLQGQADFTGVTMDEYLQMQWANIMAQGWLTGAMPDIYWVPLNTADLRKIKKSDGSSATTSKDVVDTLREKVAA